MWNFPASDNLNKELLTEYQKGLVVHLLLMLKISLDEVQRLKQVEEDFRSMKGLVTEFINETEQGQMLTLQAKEKFKSAKNMKQNILDRMNGINPNQIKLF